MKKAKRYAIAMLLLPVCYGISLASWTLLHLFHTVPEGSFYFFLGVGSYFVFQWAFFRPIRTYVFGHELTHAVAAWMTGGKVKHFHVSKQGGSVTVTKSNAFVALAPYMVPLYALLILGLYYAINYFYPLHPYWNGFLWLLGSSLGFHLALTAFALQQNQPDLKTAGKFLSAIIIYLGNAVATVFLLGVLFPHTVSWSRFARLSGHHTVSAIAQVGRGGQVVWREAMHVAEHRN